MIQVIYFILKTTFYWFFLFSHLQIWIKLSHLATTIVLESLSSWELCLTWEVISNDFVQSDTVLKKTKFSTKVKESLLKMWNPNVPQCSHISMGNNRPAYLKRPAINLDQGAQFYKHNLRNEKYVEEVFHLHNLHSDPFIKCENCCFISCLLQRSDCYRDQLQCECQKILMIINHQTSCNDQDFYLKWFLR